MYRKPVSRRRSSRLSSRGGRWQLRERDAPRCTARSRITGDRAVDGRGNRGGERRPSHGGNARTSRRRSTVRPFRRARCGDRLDFAVDSGALSCLPGRVRVTSESVRPHPSSGQGRGSFLLVARAVLPLKRERERKRRPDCGKRARGVVPSKIFGEELLTWCAFSGRAFQDAHVCEHEHTRGVACARGYRRHNRVFTDL